ncbi:MAG TPA: D-glycero-beta-D-manno-heptose 1-phosphate adenylyltransferase [Bacteroidia bacterium]|jgi:rfaE bifunctional protein nucleotidyltransferase chain/domain|nr:D-glycero-beta-D-manno-heptose 1-phosphate adenylyltransferase [Bacteroidia bacterium]
MRMTRLEALQSKIQNKEQLARTLALWRFKDRKIVFTNGCFDLLHKGHVTYLAQAAELGDLMVLGLNSDISIKKLNKGSNRPIQDQESRALILASLESVGAIIIFDEDTPAELIKFVQPDVLVKGGDWKPEQIAGYDTVKAKGGEVTVIDYIQGFSTTSIEQKIKG